MSGRVVGRFVILRELGRGGMATVYLAEQTDLRRRVALKELSSFHAGDDALAARFLREAQLSGSLTHPNIVTVHEYLEHEGIPYIAMEYCPRGSLRSRVHDLTLAQVAGVVEGVLAALAAAESRGIVHRDLKPENLMVTTDGGVKITDFGIAKALDTAAAPNLTMTGSTVGTPHYMAPEQAMGLQVGPYTDLYSVGIIAYEMLAGRVPYAETATPMAVLLRQVNEPIEPLAGARPDLDPAICAWVDAMVAKDPADRPPRAGDAWLQLEDAILAVLGPRWRRQARLLATPDEVSTAKPLTPAPFMSISGEGIDGSPAAAAGEPTGTPGAGPGSLQPLETVAPAAIQPMPGAATVDTPDVASPTPRPEPEPTSAPPLPAAGPTDLRHVQSTEPGDNAARLRMAALLLLVGAVVAGAIAALTIALSDRGGTGAAKPAISSGLHAVAGRAVPIGTHRVVLAGSSSGAWLMTRGQGAQPGTVAPMDNDGRPGAPISLGGIPAGIVADSHSVWALEVSGYQHQQVFLERVDPRTGTVVKAASFPDHDLPCLTDGSLTCNPVMSGGLIWAPVGSTLYGAPVSKPDALRAITTGGTIRDLVGDGRRLWLISGKSLLRIDASTGAMRRVLGPDTFPHGVQPFHLAAGQGHVWVSAASGRGATPNPGRLVSVDATGGGTPAVISYPYVGSIALRGHILWVERYDGEDELRALDAATGDPLGSTTTLSSDIAWLVPLGDRLLASTFDARTGARAIVPLSVVR
jgi:hypothetical protein